MIASTRPSPRATERPKIARGEVDTCPASAPLGRSFSAWGLRSGRRRATFTRAHVRVRCSVLAVRRTVRETGRMSEQLPDARVLASLLGDQPSTSTEAVAERLHIGADLAERCVAALERDGLVERADGDAWRLRALAPHELRELYPAVAILETLALRQSPPFEESTLEALRAA